MSAPRRIVFITDRIEGGGAERYVRETSALLRARGMESNLLYAVEQPMTADLAAPFDGVFPIVDLATQLDRLAPDLAYLHQVSTRTAELVAASGIPTLRFVHDHAMFCPREHKYTARGSEPCTRAVGIGCYPCTGGIRRDPRSRKVTLATLGPLRDAWRALAAHDAIVVGSRYMADHVAQHGLPAHRIHVAPLFGPAVDDARESVRLHGEVLFVGALTTGKGVDVLFRALPRVSAVTRLFVVGEGPQGAELRRHARQLGVLDRVTFTGRLSPAALAERYARAACLVLPSRQPETFGLVGVEAMARGIPVVATAIGGTSEWLTDGVTGLGVPANDPDALARALARALRPAIGDHLGRAARAAYAARFTPAHHVDRLVKLAGDVLARRRMAC